MAKVIVTVKLMPESPEVDLQKMRAESEKMIDSFTGEEAEKRVEERPLAFGLKSLHITFVMEESQGSTESLENELARVGGVQSVDIVDVRRAIG